MNVRLIRIFSFLCGVGVILSAKSVFMSLTKKARTMAQKIPITFVTGNKKK